MSCFLSSHKTLFSVALSASLLAGMTSCQDEDFGYSADQIKYNKSFTDIYGKIPADKSWDLSSFAKRSNDSSETRATRAGDGELTEGDEYNIGNWWEVPSQTLSWLERALIEGHDNTYLGSNFVLKLPQNDFAIIPIYQGRSSIHSELEIKINGYGIKSIWNKGDNILVNDHTLTEQQIKALALPQNEGVIKSSCESGNYWHEIGYYIGWASGDNPKTIHSDLSIDDLKAMDAAYRCDKYPSYTDEASRVLTKPIYFDSSKIGVDNGGYMYLSLHNTGKAWAHWENNYSDRWDKKNQSTTIGHRLTSLNQKNYMLALNVTGDAKPTAAQLSSINLANNRSANPPQVLMIACEDANGPESDMDINDVVFLIVGYPDVPTVVPTKEVIEKRYMCEDLGGTFDYDFNDIVVDLKQVQEYEIITTPSDFSDPTSSDNITITETRKKGCPVQTAKISRLCGTIPLQIQVGAYVFPKITDPTDMSQTRSDLAGSGYLINPHKHDCHDCDLYTRAHGDALNNDGSAKGWNPNEERVIPCHTWDPDKNNITIWADWGYRDGWHEVKEAWEQKHQSNPFPANTQDFADFSNGRKVPVTFPENGQAPYIIAFDPSIPWMEEGKRIPEAWLKGEDLSVVNPETGIDRDNIDKIGNSFYMENYPAPDGEGRIWEDNLTGLAYGTGVSIKTGTAEFAAYQEALNHQYYVMHIYTQAPKSGETSRVALYLGDTWKPNDKNDHGTTLDATSDPDDYYSLPLADRVHATYQSVGSDFQCTTIYLTPAQSSAISAHGVAVVSCTDGLVIRKITMARPCLYDNDGTNVLRDNGRVMIDPGFTVQFAKSSITHGRVIAEDSERASDVVPYISAKYISGTSVKLTAIANKGYKLDHWTVNSESKSGNPLTLTHTASSESDDFVFNVTPVFAEAVDPELKFSNNATEISLTLAINGAAVKPYQLTATSLNMTTVLGTFDVNNSLIDVTPSINNGNHVLSITPKAVGETEFIVYQPDGSHGETGYGVSDELKVKVKVVDQIPAVTSQPNLGSWAMFQWHGTDANAYIVDNVDGEVHYNDEVTTDGSHQIFSGNQYGNCYRYVDLPHAKWLVAEVNSGNIEFKFNTQLGNNGDEIQGSSVTIDANSKDYCQVIDNGPEAGKKYYVINVEALRNKYGYVHLNSVRALWQQTANVAWIKADNDYSEVRAAWGTLKGKISSATIDLTKNDLYSWSDASGSATSDGSRPTGRDIFWKDSSSPTSKQGEKLIGDAWTNYGVYINLSQATVIVATVPNNTCEIAFVFNQQVGTGDNAGYNGSKIEVRPNNEYRDYCAVVADGSNYKYVIDADGLKNKLGVGYLHLNYIYVPWMDQSSYVSYIVSLKTDAYNAPNPDSAKIAALKASVSAEPLPNKTYEGNGNWITPQLNTETGVIYGANNNVQTAGLYDDLNNTAAKYIVVQVESGFGAPRFFFNYINEEGTDGFVVTTAENSQYLLSESGEAGTTSYYIDLNALRSDKTNVYLNSIRSAYGQNIKVRKIGIGVKY